MKCPYCGAEISNNSKVCEYCDSQISVTMQKEQEQLNKAACPKCGSTNIVFEREKQGEIAGKNSTAIIHSTVGVCKDCGYTWHATDNLDQPKKKNTIWWVLGWIFCWPVPAMVLIWRKKNKWDIKIKIVVTVALLLLIILLGRPGSNTGNEATKGAAVPQASATASTAIEESSSANAPKVVETTKEPQITEAPKEEDNVPKEYRNALQQAEWYAEHLYMSKQGVYNQLTSPYGENFPEDAAQYAIDNLVCDWNENALQTAISYSTTMHMSKQGVYDQLISEYGELFTKEEAQYAIDNIQADWNKNALESAISYSDNMHMSKQGIYDQLTSEYGEKFTKEEAQYAIDNIIADWNENALETARVYQDSMNMSKSDIYDQLISKYGEKFTKSEAQYAIDHLD